MNKIATTAAFVTCTLLGCAAPAFSKVITLDCEFFGSYDGPFRAALSMDTDSQIASASTQKKGKEVVTLTGKLFTDGEDYWFTGNAPSGYSNKYQVNRNDLKANFVGTYSGLVGSPLKGQCQVVEKAQPKI